MSGGHSLQRKRIRSRGKKGRKNGNRNKKRNY